MFTCTDGNINIVENKMIFTAFGDIFAKMLLPKVTIKWIWGKKKIIPGWKIRYLFEVY